MTRPDGFDEDALLAHLRGTAAPEMSARIDAAARADPALRAELEVARGLKDALAAATDGPDQRPFGWKRLEAEIAQSGLPAAAPPRPQLWRIAALLLGAAVLGQSAYIALVPRGTDAPLYETVTQAPVPAFVLAVAFAPTAEMAAIEDLLRESGARVVDGPGALGLFRLAFDDAQARDAGRDRLTASPLVDLVAED